MQSEADEYMEQAERMTRSLERMKDFKYAGFLADPDKRREYVEGLAEKLRGGPATAAQPQEPEEAPFSSEKFWSDPEEVKRAGKAVRPPKL